MRARGGVGRGDFFLSLLNLRTPCSMHTSKEPQKEKIKKLEQQEE